MIVRTGRRKGQNLYLQPGRIPVDNDVELGFIGHPALARLLAVAATAGLAHHPELLEDVDVQTGIRMLADLGAEGAGCAQSMCVHPAYRHTDAPAHTCKDCTPPRSPRAPLSVARAAPPAE